MTRRWVDTAPWLVVTCGFGWVWLQFAVLPANVSIGGNAPVPLAFTFGPFAFYSEKPGCKLPN